MSGTFACELCEMYSDNIADVAWHMRDFCT